MSNSNIADTNLSGSAAAQHRNAVSRLERLGEAQLTNETVVTQLFPQNRNNIVSLSGLACDSDRITDARFYAIEVDLTGGSLKGITSFDVTFLLNLKGERSA